MIIPKRKVGDLIEEGHVGIPVALAIFYFLTLMVIIQMFAL